MADEESTIVKVCKIHGNLKLNDVVRKDSKSFRCKACRKIVVRNNYLKNKEKINKRNNEWRLISPMAKEIKAASRIKHAPKHCESENKRKQDWKEANREKYLESCNKSIKKRVDELGDPYMKHLIVKGTALSYGDVPPELVKIKRALVGIKRIIAERNNGED